MNQGDLRIPNWYWWSIYLKIDIWFENTIKGMWFISGFRKSRFSNKAIRWHQAGVTTAPGMFYSTGLYPRGYLDQLDATGQRLGLWFTFEYSLCSESNGPNSVTKKSPEGRRVSVQSRTPNHPWTTIEVLKPMATYGFGDHVPKSLSSCLLLGRLGGEKQAMRSTARVLTSHLPGRFSHDVPFFPHEFWASSMPGLPRSSWLLGLRALDFHHSRPSPGRNEQGKNPRKNGWDSEPELCLNIALGIVEDLNSDKIFS